MRILLSVFLAVAIAVGLTHSHAPASTYAGTSPTTDSDDHAPSNTNASPFNTDRNRDTELMNRALLLAGLSNGRTLAQEVGRTSRRGAGSEAGGAQGERGHRVRIIRALPSLWPHTAMHTRVAQVSCMVIVCLVIVCSNLVLLDQLNVLRSSCACLALV
jgi:hypothetical protein